MTIKSSGLLTLAEIAAEFGGGKPYKLSNYYRGGGLVPDVAVNANISKNGYISIGMFYGATRYIPGSVFYTSPGSYTFTVPSGVTRIFAEVMAAGGGGAGGSDGGYIHNGPGGQGGNAGQLLSGWIDVTPGTQLSIYVGNGGLGGYSQCWHGGPGNYGEPSYLYHPGLGYVFYSYPGAGGPDNGQDNNGVTCNGDVYCIDYICIEYQPGIEGMLVCIAGYCNTYNTGYQSTPGQNSSWASGGYAGGTNSPGGNGYYGSGGGGGGCVLGSCVSSAYGGRGGDGAVKITW